MSVKCILHGQNQSLGKLGGSNPNLLDNWYFANPINQRGQTEYTGAGYTIDRHRITGNLKVIVEEGYINLDASVGIDWFEQVVEKSATDVQGKTFTLSALTLERQLLSATGTFLNTESTTRDVLASCFFEGKSTGIRLYWFGDHQYPVVQFQVNTGDAVKLVAWKLELGSEQTLAYQDENGNWVLNEIPNYAEQMAICKQYNPTTGAYVGLTPEQIGAANAEVHNIKTYTSLEQIGVSDATFEGMTFVEAMEQLIHYKMPAYSMLWLTFTSDTHPNLYNLFNEKVIEDIDRAIIEGTNVTINIEKPSTGSTGLPIFLYGDTQLMHGISVMCMFDRDNDIANVTKFAHTRVSSMTGGSNPNLLDNWYFADPINQRGKAEYTEGGYTIDRWKSHRNNRFDVDTGTFYFDVGNTYQQLSQVIEGWKGLIDKTVTLSALVETDVEFYIRIIYGTSASNELIQLVPAGTKGVVSVTGIIPQGATQVWVQPVTSRNTTPTSGSVKLTAAKLELGSEQTLAHQNAEGNWVLNDPPPNKQQELAKCQRYFIKQGLYTQISGGTYATGAISAGIALPVAMRTTPSIKYDIESTNNCVIVDGTKHLITSITPIMYGMTVMLNITIDGTLTRYVPYYGTIINLEFSADL